MNNLMWLADNDIQALLALIACRDYDTCDECKFSKYKACQQIGGYHKWLMQEHVDDNNGVQELDYWDDCSTCEEIDHLQRENINLANDLGACMAERDEIKRKLDTVIDANSEYRDALEKTRVEREALRKNLSAMLDAAQEIRRIGALYGVD